jgi:LacI family transcriptional regulator
VVYTDPAARAKPGEHPPSVYDHPYDGDILHGVEAAAAEVGLDVLICRHCAEKLPRLIERQEVDGVIVLAAGDDVRAQIRELNLPAVNLINEYASFHSISVADYQGIYDAVQYLAGLGHSDIAYIGHLVDPDAGEVYKASRRRFAGFQAAMRDCGLEAEYVDTSLDLQNLEVAAAAMEGLWKKSRGKITAVVCYNDILAMGAIRALQQQGVCVPEEVSVTGLDDISRQFAFTPSVTSGFYDRFRLGQRAVEILWNSRPQWLAGKKTKLVHEELPVQLAVRESTAPPRTKKEMG